MSRGQRGAANIAWRRSTGSTGRAFRGLRRARIRAAFKWPLALSGNTPLSVRGESGPNRHIFKSMIPKSGYRFSEKIMLEKITHAANLQMTNSGTCP